MGGKIKYVCTIQNLLLQSGLKSKVLWTKDHEYFVVGSREMPTWDFARSLPGNILKDPKLLKFASTDNFKNFNENCDPNLQNSLLKPTILSL